MTDGASEVEEPDDYDGPEAEPADRNLLEDIFASAIVRDGAMADVLLSKQPEPTSPEPNHETDNPGARGADEKAQQPKATTAKKPRRRKPPKKPPT
jgi:hypothetical protein